MKNRYIPPEHLAPIRAQMRGRDRLITDLLIETGFRLDDVMNVRIWQISGEKLTLTERKTGNRREAVIPEYVREKVALAYKGKNRLRYAFPALRWYGRKKMHRTTYWRHFLEAVRRAGYKDRGYTPHSLRKVYAVRRLAETRSVEAVQKDLGHRSLATTLLYAVSDRF